MALQNNDLLVVQSQVDSKLYKLRIDSLDSYLEGSSGIQFRGNVDLNNGAAAQTPAITLPAANGDLYIVESDADPINADWVMESGVTTANANDRIIWSAGDGNWILVAGGTSTGGTVTDITATLPLESDGDAVTPVISVREARTTTAANTASDGKGTEGVVKRLAEDSDVDPTTGTGSSTAVVTADLLKETNQAVAALVSGGGATTITEGGTDIITGALDITTGIANDVTIGVNKETFCPYDFSSLTDITA